MMNRYFAVLGLALLSTVVSQAGLTVGYVNATDVSGSTWQFNYQLTLADSDELAPATINGVAQCLSGNGVSAPTTTTCTNSTFATIYDIPNLVNNLTTPSVGSNTGWGVVTQFVGVTPVNGGGPVNAPNGDDNALMNVTFYYTGGTIYCGGTPTVPVPNPHGCVGTYQSVFSGFSLQVTGSTGATNNFGSYTSSVTNADAYNLQGVRTIQAVNFGSGSLTIPMISSTSTPEPASIALLGLGLVGLAFAGRKIRR